MESVDARLIQRLKDKLHLGQSRVYALIAQKVGETHLPRHLAALALANERGISISKYASADDLRALRDARAATPSPVVAAPAATAARSGRIARPARRTAEPRRGGTSVFVIHGRNETARVALFDFLRSIRLHPIEWNQAIRGTRRGTPYVGQVLEAAFRRATAVVVLMTPDDEARLREPYRRPNDPAWESALTGQARPNVLFEAGMAFGKYPDRTVLVQLGYLREFSDVGGRHVVHLSNAPRSRQELATKLENAGCAVDRSGTDWLSAGDFTIGPTTTRRRARRRAVRHRRTSTRTPPRVASRIGGPIDDLARDLNVSRQTIRRRLGLGY